MNKEDLNYEPFFNPQGLQMTDDPVQSVKSFFKYHEEEQEIKNFLSSCTLEDFIWVIVRIFKEEYGDGALLAVLISDIGSKQKGEHGVTYYNKSNSRSDISSLEFEYDENDYFTTLRLHFAMPFSAVDMAINDALNGKQYTFSNGKYTLAEDSGIEHIEANPNSFILKANMDKAILF